MKMRELFDLAPHQFELHPTVVPDETNSYEVNCEICGEPYFVDGLTFDAVTEAIREGLDNPFVCTGCERTYKNAHFA